MEDALYDDPSLKAKGKQEILKQLVSTDLIQNLNYLGQVIMEALRFCPILPETTEFLVTKDVVAGNYTFKANDSLAINMHGLHFNKNEW